MSSRIRAEVKLSKVAVLQGRNGGSIYLEASDGGNVTETRKKFGNRLHAYLLTTAN